MFEGIPVAPSRQRTLDVKRSGRPNAKNTPPVFTSSAATARKKAPHPIFGVTPKGFRLVKEHLSMLDYWHAKTVKAIAANMKMPASSKRDDLHNMLTTVQGKIYEAALKVKPLSCVDVARQFEIILRESVDAKTVTILGVSELRRLVRGLLDVTQPIAPAKIAAPLTKGSKLTRAGLLRRYQSFLIGELETVSWNLYGERDFGFQWHFRDDAVDKQCRKGKRKGGYAYPFFNEAKLPARARAVLKSLRIDAVKAEARETR